jgi:hypothetical protein
MKAISVFITAVVTIFATVGFALAVVSGYGPK